MLTGSPMWSPMLGLSNVNSSPMWSPMLGLSNVKSVTMFYASGSQPVVRGPLVVRGHLPGGPRAEPDIYVYLN